MGAVYEARQEPLDRRVALKTLHADHAKNQESIARFFKEAKVLSRLGTSEHRAGVGLRECSRRDGVSGDGVSARAELGVAAGHAV